MKVLRKAWNQEKFPSLNPFIHAMIVNIDLQTMFSFFNTLGTIPFVLYIHAVWPLLEDYIIINWWEWTIICRINNLLAPTFTNN